MVKLHASYGLKVPAAQEYSSESFHATAEIELADSLVNKPDALRAALHSLWGNLKAAVHEEIATKRPQPGSNGNGHSRYNGQNGQRNGQYNQPANRVGTGGNQAVASKKQISFLLSLTRRKRNMSAEQTRQWLQSERGLDLNALSRAEAGTLIDELNDNQN
jgi:hypothetical protein